LRGCGGEKIWPVHCFYLDRTAGRTLRVDSAARNADKIERVAEGGNEEAKGRGVKNAPNGRRKPEQGEKRREMRLNFLKMMIATLMTAFLVSAFWLGYHANQRERIKELGEQIQDLQQVQYEQRKEIAGYHGQEIKLRQEITRLKYLLERQSYDTFQNVMAQQSNPNEY
jgi:cell division protein FtsB